MLPKVALLREVSVLQNPAKRKRKKGLCLPNSMSVHFVAISNAFNPFELSRVVMILAAFLYVNCAQ